MFATVFAWMPGVCELGLVLIFAGLLSAVLAERVAAPRNCQVTGFLLGLFFGPLGVLIAALIRRDQHCETCGGLVDRPALICPHCRHDLKISVGRHWLHDWF